ncbi:MAG: hypothetical protein M0Q43_11710 [Methanothrix sp.]|nr:hypothetical protein [Methanothrix sp.]
MIKANPVIDQKAYELANDYLLKIPGVTERIIEKYQNLSSTRPKPVSKNELYHCLLESAQNANMKTKVIGDAIGGVDRLALISNDFDPEYILKSYASKWDVLDHIVEKLNPRGKIRRTQRSIWPSYCQTILSAAEFIDIKIREADADLRDWANQVVTTCMAI